MCVNQLMARGNLANVYPNSIYNKQGFLKQEHPISDTGSRLFEEGDLFMNLMIFFTMCCDD